MKNTPRKKAKTVQVDLDKVCIDEGTQSRVQIDDDTVEEYAGLLRDDDNFQFPPIDVVQDEQGRLIAWDGIHRAQAYRKAGRAVIPARVVRGTLRDAKLKAAGANATHGLKRTQEDKDKAIRMLLTDPEWSGWSNRDIAKHCSVWHTRVSSLREALTGSRKNERVTYTDKHGNVSEMNVSKIGKSQSKSNKEDAAKEQVCQSPAVTGAGTSDRAAPEEEQVAPAEPVDAFQNPLPRRCRDAYRDPWIQTAIDLLATLGETLRQGRLADGLNKRKAHYPFFNLRDFVDGCAMADNTIDQLLQHLKDFRPAGVCPRCQGDGCPACKQSGLVPRKVYEELTR